MRDFLGMSLQQHLMAGAAIVAVATASPAVAQTRQFNVPAQPASRGIPVFARQAGVQIIASGNVVRDRRTNAVQGNYSVGDGLRMLLQGTGLTANGGAGGIITVRATSGSGEAQAGGAAADSESADAQTGVSEILVVGSRSQNVDIHRSEDDIQPYVVLTHDEIARSGVTNLAEFLATRLPMNAERGREFQPAGSGNQGGGGGPGQISLRGLGPDQTLILVDGRRVPGVAVGEVEGVGQPSITGISLASVERIEVLPATAGGIYGGNATGGVINIILKRDYTGLDVEAIHGNTFDSKAGYSAINVNLGFAPDHHTNVTLRASLSHQNGMQIADRDFQRQARERALVNNPAAFFPPVSSTTNICSVGEQFPGSSAFGLYGTCGSGGSLILDPAYGGTNLGSSVTSIPIGYAGPSTDGGTALVRRAGIYNLNSASRAGVLFSPNDTQAYALTLNRRFGSAVEAFLDGEYNKVRGRGGESEVDASAVLAPGDPNNPFQQTIQITVPLTSVLQQLTNQSVSAEVRGGVTWHISPAWAVSLEHSWSRTDFSVTRNQFSVNPNAYLSSIAFHDIEVTPPDVSMLDLARITEGSNYRATLNDTAFRFSGSLFHVPGGSLVLSGYLESRGQDLAPNVTSFVSTAPGATAFRWRPARSQDVRSGYLEARAPLVSPALSVPLIHQLEVFGALRYDAYRTEAATGAAAILVPSANGPFPSTYPRATNRVESANYTAGLRYSPVAGISLRASFGTGFLPPNLAQVIPNTNTISAFLARLLIPNDPRRGNTAASVGFTQTTGGNAEVEPEASKSLSVGVILEPRLIPGLRISIDYVKITKTGEIRPLDLATLLALEGSFPGRVTRGANLPGDQPGWAGPITSINQSATNIAHTRVEAIDLQVDYEIRTGVGIFRPFFVGTHQTQLRRQYFPNSTPFNILGFNDGPLRWRGNFGINWEHGGWRAGWSAQYYGTYNICNSTDSQSICSSTILTQGGVRVRSQTYHDLFVSYSFGASGGLGGALNNTQLQLGIQNVFNQDPPIIATQGGLGYSPFGDPRLRRFTLAVRRHF